MDDFVLAVRQIVQYPRKTVLDPTDLVLLQESDSTGLAAGAYKSANVVDFISTALAKGGSLKLSANNGITWNGASLMFTGGTFFFNMPVSAPQVFVGTFPVATQNFVLEKTQELAVEFEHSVRSFNFRTGDVLLEEGDILRAGGAPQLNPHLHGDCTAPSVWDVRQSNDTIATTNWVQRAVCFNLERMLQLQPFLLGHNGCEGAHPIGVEDINDAYGVTNTFPASVNPPLGDASNRIATTLFVDESMADLQQSIINDIQSGLDLSGYAKLNSPQFVGIPTADTANPGTNTGQLATTAFVQAAVAASTAGVASFNGRTGVVTLTTADITGAGGAVLNSPIFTGVPTAPTAAPGNSSPQLATTAFVMAAIAALAPAGGVTSFNTRTGAVVLTTGDITTAGGAPTASPAFSGTPTAPTVAQTVNDQTLATTAFVHTAIAALPTSVASFNNRTGAVTLQGADVSAAGGALVASPTFTGAPSAPTVTPATDSSTKIATTAFVQSAIASMTAGVASFNGRSGVVTLTAADITGAGGALLASPALTGVPTAPTAAQTSNDTTLATTAYVRAAIAGVNTGVVSFNSRTGAVTLQGADVSAAGGALLASPALTGTPTGPTAGPGTNTTQLATTAFVTQALSTAGGVSSFNGRAGAVTLTAADVTGVGGALLAGPTFTGIPAAPTAAPGTNTTQIATTAFVAAASSGAVAPGNRVLLATQTVSTPVASVAFYYPFDSTYDVFEIEAYDIQFTVADAYALMCVSVNGTSLVTGTVYNATGSYTNTADATNTTWGYNAVGVNYMLATQLGDLNSQWYAHLKVRFARPYSITRVKNFFIEAISQSAATGMYNYRGFGQYNAVTQVKGVGFNVSSGNFKSGVFKLYGIKL